MANSGLQGFYEELKRRRVIRVATLYVIAFWPIVQVVDILTPALGLPDSFMKYLVFAFFGAMPFVVIFSWLYDLNREGIKRDDGQTHRAMFSSKSEFTFVATLVVLVIGLFLVQMNMDIVQDTGNSAQLIGRPDTEQTVTYDSIAVLPFVSFSDESRDQFFADGLTEELLNVLSRITDLRVAARTSSFAYKGVSKNVQIIGQELNVATILEGSVRKNDIDDTIRVTAQLIDVKTGAHLWSESFDRQFTDIFKIQDEISAAVADHLRVTLKGGTGNVPRHASVSPEVMIANSMGQAELAKRTEQGFRDAARYFERAIAGDDQYALAYTGLADANTLLVNYGFEDREKGLDVAREAIDKALAIDPDLGIAWASRGLLLSQTMDTKEQAKQALHKAMELNPSYAMAFMWYASMLSDPDRQLEYYQKASELDPRSAVAGYNVAKILVEQGRDSEAMQLFSQIVEADPFYAGAYLLVGNINDRHGRLVEAIRQMERSYDLQNDPSIAAKIAKLYADVGDFSNADDWISRVEDSLPEQYRMRLTWLKVYRYAAEGNVEEVQPFIDEILQAPVRTASDSYLRALAAYFNGDYDITVAAFEQASNFAMDHMGRDGWDAALKLDAQIAAAYAYKEMGQQQKSLKTTAAVEQILDLQLEKGGLVDPAAWYRRATVAAIRGKDQAALISLQRAIDEGWREHWKPGFDPAMQGLMSKRPFQAMLAGLETRMDIIREQFEMDAQFATGWPG
ncbi:MAG: tetratricopeptide repeat protein [bacterium]|nr:tetratricopeptide repeat protein [Gammaproteobacteria bacterium]